MTILTPLNTPVHRGVYVGNVEAIEYDFCHLNRDLKQYAYV
jgi:hypothetical protein